MASGNYYFKRVFQAAFTLFVVTTMAFVLIRLMPGGPMTVLRMQVVEQMQQHGGQVDQQELNRIVQRHLRIHPEEGIWEQYVDYMSSVLLQGNFGESYWQNDPVFEILFKAMPWSVFISIYGLVLGFATNIVLGSVMAYKEGSRFDSATTVIVIILNSIPYYVAAIAFLAVFAYGLGLFPSGGRMPRGAEPAFSIEFMKGISHHAALPIISSFVVGFGGGALSMRGNAIRVLGDDSLRVARLRGISSTRIAIRYVLRNSVLPLYTGLMIGIAGIFSSSVILEYIFTYPGVGWYTFQALEQRDMPLLMGSFIFFTVITLIGVLIADLTYGLIDPRIKTGDQHESF